MPEYLAPGVYVEEVSFRSRFIEGVSTSTTAFVGPTRKGPLTGTPEVITSFGEYARVFGGIANLTLGGASGLNYMAHGVSSFFNNGGSRLYVARTYVPAEGSDGVAASALIVDDDPNQARFVARMPGSGLNGTVIVSEKLVPATLVTLNAAPQGSLLRVDIEEDPPETEFYRKQGDDWVPGAGDNFDTEQDPLPRLQIVTMNLEAVDEDGNTVVYEDLGFDAAHPRHAGVVLTQNPTRRTDAILNPYFLELTGAVSAFALHTGLFAGNASNRFAVTGGNDGVEPGSQAYDAALLALEDIDNISIVAAPGHSEYESFQAAQQSLLSHAERMRYRIAVLDTPLGQSIGEARETRSRIDSTYGALYYPGVVVANPLARPGNDQIEKEITLPPSGFVAGIYARNDIQRGVWKAPANEIVRGALRFEREINHRQQEVLNPEGVNCLRYFFGRGNRVWGARTVSSDPEWKYVPVRRFMIFVEHSIDRSTQWAVFEPNGERLWANIRETISSFVYGLWRNGALLGSTPEEAYFVRCDRSTMTQDDIDNGRLICEIGIAVLKPAEFVIFRIGQKTADARQ